MKSKESSWFVFYTLPKHEKKVLNLLLEQNYKAYLPTQKVERQWSDRKKMVVVPLFPNYVFVKTQPTQLYYILSTSGIVRVLTEDRQPVSIPDEEIERIQIMISAKREVEVTSFERGLVPGASIKVSEGPFAGLYGRLVSNKGNYRLLVELKALNKLLHVDISAAYLHRAYEVESFTS